MKIFNQKEILKTLQYPELIDKLEASFQEKYEVPSRMHYDYKSGEGDDESTLLLMPAWKNEKYVGLKIIAVSPYNKSRNPATIQGIYILIDARDGTVIAQFDAKSLTNRRTAASSALTSKYLSGKNATTLLIVGAGALAPELIKAHCSVRPINKVLVWERNFEKARRLTQQLTIDDVEVTPVKNIEDFLS